MPLLSGIVIIHWLTRTTAANPHIVQGQASPGLLSEEESAFFTRFTVRKRRQDWLLGRWTVKLLLQEIIRQEQGKIVALNRITILPDSDGAPQAIVNAAGISPSPAFSISISHSNGRSLCAAVPLPDWPLGVDIERIEPRASSFAANFFTVREQQQLAESEVRLRETLETAIWSGKEAALKATRQGLRTDTRALSCLFAQGLSEPGGQSSRRDGASAFTTESSAGWLPFEISWERQPHRGVPHLQGWWTVDNGFVLTMAAKERRAECIPTPRL